VDELTLAIFFRTIKVREELLMRGWTHASALARVLDVETRRMREDLDGLVRAGLVRETHDGFALTDEGEASVRWSAPPPPDGVMHPRWVSELARVIADYYAVGVGDMLRSAEPGPAVVARSRLCFALWARGWAVERIEEHFGMPSSWARRAVERWKRMRDQVAPKSGAELRAWRERLGLTQAQAAARLGVSKRTVIRAEAAPLFTSRMAVARG
jgi:hypothetical protein